MHILSYSILTQLNTTRQLLWETQPSLLCLFSTLHSPLLPTSPHFSLLLSTLLTKLFTIRRVSSTLLYTLMLLLLLLVEYGSLSPHHTGRFVLFRLAFFPPQTLSALCCTAAVGLGTSSNLSWEQSTPQSSIKHDPDSFLTIDRHLSRPLINYRKVGA